MSGRTSSTGRDIPGKEGKPGNEVISSPGAAENHTDPAPSFFQTAFSANLAAPQALSISDQRNHSSATHLEDTTHTNKEGSSWADSTLRFAKSVVSSHNFYTSISNVFITSNLYTGLSLHPACALLAIANEAREKRREQGEYKNPPPRFTGLAQNALDIWRSPGIYRIALSVAFLVNSVESGLSNDFLFSVIYLCASLGNIGAARIANREYFCDIYKDRGKEYRTRGSATIQLLTSPGLNWSITDVLVGMMTLPPLGAIASTIAYSAAACAGVAVVAPLTLGRRMASSPLPLICNTVCNWGFSLVHLLWGSQLIAISCAGWGIASAIIARKQHLQNAKNQSGTDQ